MKFEAIIGNVFFATFLLDHFCGFVLEPSFISSLLKAVVALVRVFAPIKTLLSYIFFSLIAPACHLRAVHPTLIFWYVCYTYQVKYGK